MEELLRLLNQMHPVSKALEMEIKSVAHFIKKNRNEFLIKEHEDCHFAWYLKKGLVRCYYEREDREVTTWFREEEHVIVLFKALFGRKKSFFNVQALEDCELCAIHYLDLQHIYKKYPEAIQLHHILAEDFSNLKDLKIRATSMLSPKQRYAYFVKHYPQLLNRLKLEYIASYLDISESSLARARRQ